MALQVQQQMLVPTHRDIAQTEAALASLYMSVDENDRAARHGLKAVQLMKAVFPANTRAPMIAHMQLSLAKLAPQCRGQGLASRVMTAVLEGRACLDLMYGSAWQSLLARAEPR